MNFKPNIEEYTEAEFLAFVKLFFENDSPLQGSAYVAWKSSLMEHFVAITEHPDRSDVICFPPAGADRSPAGIVERIKEWREANGKPGFKPA